jgi:hypothetical protein
MPPEEGLRPHTDRLAHLLADGRGAQILAELQKLAIRSGPTGVTPAATDPGPDGPSWPRWSETDVGVWRIERGNGERAALRRNDDDCGESAGSWADVEYIPPEPGARRVVVLGESAAHGCPYDPMYSPTIALDRLLSAAKPGGFQCIDLAKTGATAGDLDAVADRLALLEPDVVISFAGNNWSLAPEELEFHTSLRDELDIRDRLAQALRDGGYAGMRSRFIDTVVLPRVRGYLDRLRDLQRRHPVEIVIVVPEFNLMGWTPPADIETPAMPAQALAQWHALRQRAEQALALRSWSEALSLAERMRQFDNGTSSIPGYLLGRALVGLGDHAGARTALEQSRDAVCGLFVRYTPRILGPVQDALTSYAAEYGWACVDLRTELASTHAPQLPDPALFHDYCHLSDAGIERVAASLADQLLGRAPGTTQPGPGVPEPVQAFIHARAALHMAHQGQPAETVLESLHACLRTDPSLAEPLSAIRDLLHAPRPAWTHPATQRLVDLPGVRSFLVALAGVRGLSPELWLIRACLDEVLEPGPAQPTAADVDLLRPPDHRGHGVSNWTQPRCHLHATSRASSLHFAAVGSAELTLDLTYRMPADGPTPVGHEGVAQVRLNGEPAGELPWSARWTTATLVLPVGAVRSGVNRLEIRWPVPALDLDRRTAADADALARGEMPYVLCIFGEVYEARLRGSDVCFN